MYTQKQRDRLLETLLDGKAVRCKTADENNALFEILNDAGMCWASGTSLLEKQHWTEYREDTAYNYETDGDGIMFCHAQWYSDYGYTVVDFKEIITSEPQSAVSLMEYMSL